LASGEARRLRELRRRCEDRLQDVELPTPFDVRRFAEMVAARRDRAILLKGIHTEGETLGAWVPLARGDVIVFEERTSTLHQQHIILHELSHLLCGHHADARPTDLLPDLRPEVVEAVLHRHRYSTEAELEAELMASLIRERAAHNDALLPRRGMDDGGLAGRLEAFRKGEPSA
jgi:hypothetical protein